MMNEDTNINLDKAQARKDVKELKKFWLADFNKMHESRYRDPNAVLQEFMVNNLHKDKTQFTALEDVGITADKDYRNRLITTLKGGLYSGADLFMGLGRFAETGARFAADKIKSNFDKTKMAAAFVPDLLSGKKDMKDFINQLQDYNNKQYEALRQRSEAEVKWTKSLHENFAKAIGIAADEKDDPLFTTIGSAAGSVVQSMVGGVVLKAPKLVAALWGVAQAQDSWEEARQNGIGRTQAAAAAVSNGTLNALIENMALERILKAFKLNKPLGKILESFLTEGSEEFLQGVVDESLMQSLGGIVKEFKDTLQDLYVAFIIGGISGGAVAGAHSAFEKLVNITGKEKAESIAKAVAAAAASPQAQAETDKIIHRQEHPANFPNDSAKVAIDQTKAAILEQDRVKQLNNISTEFETFFKNNGIDEDTAAAGGRIAANVVNLISLQNGITPELARDYLNLDILREQIKNGQISVAEHKEGNNTAEKQETERFFQFGGPQAQNAETLALDKAKEMEQSGTDNETIRRQTGWFKGADGKWRFEISDKDAEINSAVADEIKKDLQQSTESGEKQIDQYNNELRRLTELKDKKQISEDDFRKQYDKVMNEKLTLAEKLQTQRVFRFTLGEVLKHDKLFKAYPELKNMPVEITPMGYKTGGSFDGEIIELNSELVLRNNKESRETLLHEIQHAIQRKENFARGGSAEQFADRAKQAELKRDLAELKKREQAGEDVSEEIAQAEFELNSIEEGQTDKYLHLAGEMEARNTERRANMSDQERQDTAPQDTQDYKDSDAIVVFGGNETAYHPQIAGLDGNRQVNIVDLTAQQIRGKKALQKYINSLIGKRPIQTADGELLKFESYVRIKGSKNQSIPYHIVKSSKAKQPKERKIAIKNILDLIKQSVLVDVEGVKPNKIDYNVCYRFYVPVRVGTDIYPVRIVALQNSDNIKIKADVYDVIFENKISGADSINLMTQGPTPDTISLADFLSGVKASDNVLYTFTKQNNIDNDTTTLNQGHRGTIDLYKKGGVYHALVKLMQTSDKTTLLHEMAHLWLYTAQDIYSAKEFADIKNDLDNWIGKPLVVNGRFIYSEKQQEKFAKGLEEYLRQGQAPTPALKRIFEKLCLFFRNVYNGALVDMSPAGRAVYDRMFTLGKQQAQQAMTFHQDPVKNKKTVKAIKQLRETGTTDVEGISLKDIENYLSILDAGAPPKPKDTLLKYLKKYGADYANCGKIDKEQYQNAKIPNKKGGIQDDLFRQLKDWGFMDADAYSYGELSELNEQAADLIDRALSGEDIFRLEDTADAENYQQYLEAVDMAEDALGGKIDEYRRVKKIIQGLRVEGYRPVNKRDIAFLLKQIEQVQDAAQKAMQPKIDAAKAQAKLNKEIAERRLSDLQSAKVQARQEQEEKTLKENVFKAEDITELHHQLTGETIPINDHIKGNENKEIETVKVEKLHFKDKENTKNISNEEIANILFVKNENRSKKNDPLYMPLELKNKDGKTYLLSRSSADKIINTIYKTGNLKESKDKKELLCNIKDIFAKADKIISHKDIKGIKRNIDRFATVAKIGDRTYMILFTVKNGKLEGSEILSLYNMEADKKEAPSTSRTYPGHREHIYTLGDLRDFVKRKIAKYNKFYAKNRAAILQELKRENEEQGTNTVQPADKTAEEQKAEVKQQDIDKKAQGLKKAVLAEISKREIENKQELLKELESAKDTADILSAADNLLDKLQREYEKTPQGQQEKRRTDVPSTDWDSKKISLLKELSELLSKQDEKTKQAFEILRQAHLVKTGYRAALDKDEQAALSKAKEFLNENFTPRILKVMKAALQDEVHLEPKDIAYLTQFYATSVIRFKDTLKTQIDWLLSAAKARQQENFMRYMNAKIEALLYRKTAQGRSSVKYANYPPEVLEFFEKAREYWQMDKQLAIQEYQMQAAKDYINNPPSPQQALANAVLELKALEDKQTPQNIKYLYDRIYELIKAGRQDKLFEKMRKQFAKNDLRAHLQKALLDRKLSKADVLFLLKGGTDLQTALSMLFGEIEIDSEYKDGKPVKKQKIDFREMLSPEINQMAEQTFKLKGNQAINQIVADCYGLKTASQIIDTVSEMLKPDAYEVLNYAYRKPENQAVVRQDGKGWVNNQPRLQKLSKLNIIGFWIWYQNHEIIATKDGGSKDIGLAARLLNAYGQEQLDQMFNLLTPQDIKLAKDLMKLAQKNYDAENTVYRRIYGFSLPTVENYFPSVADIINSTEYDFAAEYAANSKAPSFIKQRAKSEKVVQKPVNPLNVIKNHLRRAAEFIFNAEQYTEMLNLFKNSEMQTAFVNKFGQDDGDKLFKKLLDLIALQGPKKYQSKGDFYNVLDWTFNNTVKSVMGIKLSVGIKQFASCVSFAEKMPAGKWLKYFTAGLLNPVKTKNFMLESVPYISTRFESSSINEAVARAAASKNEINTFAEKYNNFTNMLTVNLRLGDAGSFIYGGYPYMRWLMQQGYSKEQAAQEVSKHGARTLQSSLAAHLSQTQAQAQDIASRTITLFRNQQMQYIRRVMDNYVKFKNGEIPAKQLGKIAFLYLILNPIIYELLGLAWLMPAADKEEQTQALQKLALSPLANTAGAYFMADWAVDFLVDNALNTAKGKKLKYARENESFFTDAVFKDINSVIKLINSEDIQTQDVINVFTELGKYAGLPLSTVKSIASGGADLFAGKPAKGALKVLGYTEKRAAKATGQEDNKKWKKVKL